MQGMGHQAAAPIAGFVPFSAVPWRWSPLPHQYSPGLMRSAEIMLPLVAERECQTQVKASGHPVR